VVSMSCIGRLGLDVGDKFKYSLRVWKILARGFLNVPSVL